MAKDTEEKASQEVDEAYRPIDPDAKAKSEAVQELFNFAKSKLPQRTRLNLKEIHQFAIMMANMAVIKESEVRTWVECYMDFLMELSYGECVNRMMKAQFIVGILVVLMIVFVTLLANIFGLKIW
jgi:hypothetical protein